MSWKSLIQTLIRCYSIYHYQVQQFKKIYYDASLGRAVSKFVPSDDLVVPYNAVNLEQAERVTHVIKNQRTKLENYKLLDSTET